MLEGLLMPVIETDTLNRNSPTHPRILNLRISYPYNLVQNPSGLFTLEYLDLSSGTGNARQDIGQFHSVGQAQREADAFLGYSLPMNRWNWVGFTVDVPGGTKEAEYQAILDMLNTNHLQRAFHVTPPYLWDTAQEVQLFIEQLNTHHQADWYVRPWRQPMAP
jgi:hypothetical protein